MRANEIIQDDDAPDAIVNTAAMAAVGIMLVGLIAFPLAGAWSRAGGAGPASVTSHAHDHDAVMMVVRRP